MENKDETIYRGALSCSLLMMNKYIEFLAKLLIAALAAVGFFVVMAIMLDDQSYKYASQRNSEYVETWLHNLEPREEEEFTADYLRQICNSKSNDDKTFCNGYMLGFIEGMDISPMTPICGAEDLRSTKQSIQAFENFMKDNPKYWEKSRAAILGAALQDAFPCGASSSQ